MSKCPVCKSEDGCRPGGISLRFSGSALNANEWREIIFFMRYVFLPFMHRIINKSRIRKRTAFDKEREQIDD